MSFQTGESLDLKNQKGKEGIGKNQLSFDLSNQ